MRSSFEGVKHFDLANHDKALSVMTIPVGSVETAPDKSGPFLMFVIRRTVHFQVR